jgi:hypothetical protein
MYSIRQGHHFITPNRTNIADHIMDTLSSVVYVVPSTKEAKEYTKRRNVPFVVDELPSASAPASASDPASDPDPASASDPDPASASASASAPASAGNAVTTYKMLRDHLFNPTSFLFPPCIATVVFGNCSEMTANCDSNDDEGNCWDLIISLMGMSANVQFIFLELHADTQLFATWLQSIHPRRIKIHTRNSNAHTVTRLYTGRYKDAAFAAKSFCVNEAFLSAYIEKKKVVAMAASTTSIERTTNTNTDYYILRGLLYELQRAKNQLPVIFVNYSRYQVKKIATMFGTFYLPDRTSDISQIINEFIRGYDRAVVARVTQTKEYIECMELLLCKRIAYYHSGMVPMLRELIEYAMRLKLISVLVTTDAWPKGDYHINTLVFMNLHKYNGQTLQYDPVSPQLYEKTCNSLLSTNGIHHTKQIIHCLDFFAKVLPFRDYSQLFASAAQPFRKGNHVNRNNILKLINRYGISSVTRFVDNQLLIEEKEKESIEGILQILQTDGFLNSSNELSTAAKLISRISQVDSFILVGALDELERYSSDETLLFLSYFVNQSRKITYSGGGSSSSSSSSSSYEVQNVDMCSKCAQLWDDVNLKWGHDYDPKERSDKWVQLLHQMTTCDKKYFEMNLLYEEEIRYMLDKLVRICHELHQQIAIMRCYPTIQYNCLQIIQKFGYATSS